MRSKRHNRWAAIPIAVAISVILAGCTQAQLQGWLPGDAETTNQTGRVIGLWVTSWIVLLAVGVLTWGLVIWAAVVYRRRKGQTGLPAQLRYNMPIEIFFTIVPLILVLGFFAVTARDQAAIEADPGNPDVKIEVFGKRWAWDINYQNVGPDGQGVYTWANGDAYKGQWQAGKKHGQGKFTWQSGDVREGRFDNDQQTRPDQPATAN